MSEPKLIPEQFVAQSNSIASYNYNDIAEGTGIVIFNGFAMTASTGESYAASQSSFYSDPLESVCNSGMGSTTVTINFDVAPFNLPKTIKGMGYIDGSWALNTAAGNSITGKITFTIQKWDGTTATDIGSVITETVSCSGLLTKRQSFMLGVNLTQTHFKRGEILRLQAALTATFVGGVGGSVYLAHDPMNRDATYITPAATYHTDLNFYIPFRLEEIGY